MWCRVQVWVEVRLCLIHSDHMKFASICLHQFNVLLKEHALTPCQAQMLFLLVLQFLLRGC
jgi:hypothetical protein